MQNIVPEIKYNHVSDILDIRGLLDQARPMVKYPQLHSNNMHLK